MQVISSAMLSNSLAGQTIAKQIKNRPILLKPMKEINNSFWIRVKWISGLVYLKISKVFACLRKSRRKQRMIRNRIQLNPELPQTCILNYSNEEDLKKYNRTVNSN